MEPRGREQKPNKIVSEAIREASSKIRFGEDFVPAELFDNLAHSVAKELAGAQERFNKPSQIRRFYDELVSWQQRIGGEESEFKKYEAFIRMMNAKIAYASGRELVDANFEHWFTSANRAVTSAKGLEHFRLHFEAVLGFLKGIRG